MLIWKCMKQVILEVLISEAGIPDNGMLFICSHDMWCLTFTDAPVELIL